MYRLLTALALVLALALPAAAQDRRPLLIEGKTELYQRVLTRPGAKVAEGVGAPGETALDPFTPLYVYQRYPVDGSSIVYLEVGTDTKGKVIGFVPETETVPWRHALVLAFSERINRERTLFFREQDQLLDWLKSDQLLVRAAEARRQIDADKLPEGGPVISVEPKELIDFEKNFYMLPILDAQQKRVGRQRLRLVEIASVTLKDADPVAPQVSRRINPEALESFRAGVVFVIDASSSMGPYIRRTREVMDGVLKRMEAEGLTDKVRFGVVAYRDDPEHVDGIEFLTRTFADPNDVATADDFAVAVEPLDASRVSTRAFAEDAFAAVDHAIKAIDWSDFGARYIILITDASARTGEEKEVGGKMLPASKTGYSVLAMWQAVRENKTALYALHLKSPVGKDDHSRAEEQYRLLSRFENLPRPLYYPVEAGDPQVFSDQVKMLADALASQVKEAKKALEPLPEPEPEKPAAEAGIAESARLIGRAMALRHLGGAKGADAPSMFRAWASDKDFENKEVDAFTVRVLLSRNQLSDLIKSMSATVEALEAGQIEPDDLFNQLRSAALSAGRDPDKIGQGDTRNMQASGLVGEYLDGLPYESRLMSLTEDNWIAMGVGEQENIIADARAKIRLYQSWDSDTDRWIALNENAAPGDHVYPVPLDALP